MNSDRYNDKLQNQLWPEIQRKHQCLLSSGMCLQHDNDQPHTAHHSVKKIQDLKLETSLHPPCSPCLSNSNFHLFWPLNGALCGCHFRSEEEIKETVHDWLAQQPNFFSLVEDWRCVGTGGDDTED